MDKIKGRKKQNRVEKMLRVLLRLSDCLRRYGISIVVLVLKSYLLQWLLSLIKALFND